MEMIARKSGLFVPAKPEPKARTTRGFTVADWDTYRHCNSEPLPAVDGRYGGGFQFGKHVGNPLSQSLWEDLVHRVGIRALWLIGDEAEWTIEPLPHPYAVVYVDGHESDIVKDIRIGGFH